MKYQKQTQVSGAWLKASELKSGLKAKLISETAAQPSSFLDKNGAPKTQDVAKIKIQGVDDSYNVSLNRATINALIEAFGEDSKDWMNKVLTVETEKVRVAGKSVTALYLIPDGYEKTDDANGYAVIARKDIQTGPTDADPIQVEDDDLPF